MKWFKILLKFNKIFKDLHFDRKKIDFIKLKKNNDLNNNNLNVPNSFLNFFELIKKLDENLLEYSNKFI